MKIALGKMSSPEFAEALKRLMNHKGLSAKSAFKIRGVAKIISGEMAKYEETKQGIINEFADKDADGNAMTEKVGDRINFKIPFAKLKECNSKLADLYNLQVEVPDISVEQIEALVDLTPLDFFQLEFLVE